jgi:hypothetical protein
MGAVRTDEEIGQDCAAVAQACGNLPVGCSEILKGRTTLQDAAVTLQRVSQYPLGFRLGQAEEEVEAMSDEAQFHLEKRLGIVANMNAANPVSRCQ